MARWLALAMSLVLAACMSRVPSSPAQTAAPSPTPSPTASPTAPAGSDEVVLRMTVGGGLRYPGATVEPPPLFTLYADGRVIYATPGNVPPGTSGRLDLQQAQITDDQMGATLGFALDQGGLAHARERYDGIPIADDVTTWFEIHVDGVSKTVAVYALGYAEDPVPDAEMRAGFRALAAELEGFAQAVRSGEVESLGVFEPEAYLVTLDQPFGPMIDGPAVAWPWDDLDLADFEPTNSGWSEAVISAAQAEQLADPVNSLPDDYVVETAGGDRLLLRIRPLLPDQLP